MKQDIIRTNKVLNILFDFLLIFISSIYYRGIDAGWIIVPYFMIMCIIIALAFSYRPIHKRFYRELQIDGIMKLAMLCMITIVLPYTSNWSIIYISLLIGMLLLDYIQRSKLYSCIRSNKTSTVHYLTGGNEDTNITIRLLFSHLIPLFFYDSNLLWKGIICMIVLLYTIIELNIFYRKYHLSYDKVYFIKSCSIYYACFFITSLMNFLQFMNFSYYLISSLSICGFWKKRKLGE